MIKLDYYNDYLYTGALRTYCTTAIRICCHIGAHSKLS